MRQPDNQQAVDIQDVSATIYENDLSNDQLLMNDTRLSGYQSTPNYSSHLDPIVNGHKRISRIAVKQQTRKAEQQISSGQGEFRSAADRSTANRRNILISNSVATGGGGNTRMKPFSAQTRHGNPNQRGNFPTTPQNNAFDSRGNTNNTRVPFGAKRGVSGKNTNLRGGKRPMIRSNDSGFLRQNLDVTSAGNEDQEQQMILGQSEE